MAAGLHRFTPSYRAGATSSRFAAFARGRARERAGSGTPARSRRRPLRDRTDATPVERPSGIQLGHGVPGRVLEVQRMQGGVRDVEQFLTFGSDSEGHVSGRMTRSVERADAQHDLAVLFQQLDAVGQRQEMPANRFREDRGLGRQVRLGDHVHARVHQQAPIRRRDPLAIDAVVLQRGGEDVRRSVAEVLVRHVGERAVVDRHAVEGAHSEPEDRALDALLAVSSHRNTASLPGVGRNPSLRRVRSARHAAERSEGSS